MAKPVEAPELYSDPSQANCGRDEYLEEIKIPISPDGAYSGDGEFQDPAGRIFKINSIECDSWTGRAYIIRRREETIY